MKINLVRKSMIVFVFIFALILSSCAAPSELPQPEDPAPQIESPVPPPATLEPTATPDPLIFRDNFEGSLDSEWQWIRENKQEWSLTNNPGWLELQAGPGHVSGGKMENVFIRPIPEGDLELETKLIFKPVTNYQFAGLLIYENDSNFIQFGRAFCINDPRCVGDGLYMDHTLAGDFIVGDNFSLPAPITDTLYLRLRREGNIYTSFFSEDGFTWVEAGSHASTMDPEYVGFVAGQSTYSYQLAQFDYFSINALP